MYALGGGNTALKMIKAWNCQHDSAVSTPSTKSTTNLSQYYWCEEAKVENLTMYDILQPLEVTHGMLTPRLRLRIAKILQSRKP